MNKQIERVAVLPKIPSTTKVAAYARVSSGKDAMLHSLSQQVSYYSEMIQNHPNWAYAGVYVDEAITGTKSERPEFQRMLMDCRSGRINLILTKSISRFARNTVTLLNVVRELKQENVDVYFEEQNIHSISPDGELMLTILASYAQEESRSVSENCKWRIRKNFEQGIPVSHDMLGYSIRNGEVLPIPDEALIVKRIFDWRLEGFGAQAIANKLNAEGVPTKHGGQWHYSTINRLLRNEKYKGDLLLQKRYRVDHLTKKEKTNTGELPQYLVQGNHEAIIPREVFDTVQADIVARASQLSHSTKPAASPFTHRVFCGRCGSTYLRKRNSGVMIWQCYSTTHLNKEACPGQQIREEVLQKAAARAIGMAAFEGSIFQDRVQKVIVGEGHTLRFIFKDHNEISVPWTPPSRRESWTEEMKEKARQKAIAQHKANRHKAGKGY